MLAPDGIEWAISVANRNFLIHQYDELNRDLTWQTLSSDLPAWNELSLRDEVFDRRSRSASGCARSAASAEAHHREGGCASGVNDWCGAAGPVCSHCSLPSRA